MSILVSPAAAAVQATAHVWPHGWDGPPFPFFVFPLFWLLLLGGIALLLVLGGRRRDRAAGERVLAERYAAGEIDDIEYRDRLAVLREKP